MHGMKAFELKSTGFLNRISAKTSETLQRLTRKKIHGQQARTKSGQMLWSFKKNRGISRWEMSQSIKLGV